MASGDLTASTPTNSNTSSVKAQIDALNLAAATDEVIVVPLYGRDQRFKTFKVEREA